MIIFGCSIKEELQDEIVGGFGTNLTDPDLLEPDEVLSLYLEKYGELDADGWMQYLGMDDFFATGSTSYASKLDRLYAVILQQDKMILTLRETLGLTPKALKRFRAEFGTQVEDEPDEKPKNALELLMEKRRAG